MERITLFIVVCMFLVSLNNALSMQDSSSKTKYNIVRKSLRSMKLQRNKGSSQSGQQRLAPNDLITVACMLIQGESVREACKKCVDRETLADTWTCAVQFLPNRMTSCNIKSKQFQKCLNKKYEGVLKNIKKYTTLHKTGGKTVDQIINYKNPVLGDDVTAVLSHESQKYFFKKNRKQLEKEDPEAFDRYKINNKRKSQDLRGHGYDFDTAGHSFPFHGSGPFAISCLQAEHIYKTYNNHSKGDDYLALLEDSPYPMPAWTFRCVMHDLRNS